MASAKKIHKFVPTIIDVEASGFGPDSYPIEVGLAFADGSRYCTLIKPEPEWQHWDNSAFELHQISREDLELHGKPIQTVCEELNNALGRSQVFTDAWVFDKHWLNRLFEHAGILPTFLISPIEAVQTECQHNCWDKVRRDIISDYTDQRHRASSDAFLVQSVFVTTQAQCVP